MTIKPVQLIAPPLALSTPGLKQDGAVAAGEEQVFKPICHHQFIESLFESDVKRQTAIVSDNMRCD